MKKLIFILGASGSGKTTSVKNIEAKYPNKYHFVYFDQPEVPSAKEVQEKYGGWENWGIERTNQWISKIKNEYIDNKITIFDIHTKPENFENSCANFGITNYTVILLDCSNEERRKRLTVRDQSHLINDSLFEWAQFLRNEATSKNYFIIDNTVLDVDEGLKKVEEKVEELSKN